ncbi:peroxidase [Escherichia coli]|nr:peroxidase [Escherichia coli]EFN7691682.1 peroxidase [Escherichia coli]EFN7709796.1 peroxidase [Escherichia coli]EFN7723271.1 peroxidase [Escherichia coli]EFN7791043.1 peroxidase [Escherichia coli]
MSQASFLFEEVGDAADIIWFFAIEVDEFRYVDRVTFTGFLEGAQVSCWEIPLNEKVPAISSIDAELPEPVKVEKPVVSVKKKEEKKAKNDDTNDGL